VQPIAHRGCPRQYPENTLTALRSAGSRAGAVEFDVRRCGTGESVVIHDERLDRVTDADGLVSETSVTELQRVHVMDSNAHVPTLQEVFQTVPEGVTLHIELKEPSVIDDVAMYTDQFAHDVIVSSFDPTALTAAVSAGLTDVALLFATNLRMHSRVLSKSDVQPSIPLHHFVLTLPLSMRLTSKDCVSTHGLSRIPKRSVH